MIPNNNLSVLPWYTSLAQQNARKWWVYDRVYPLFTPAGFLLPFQLMIEHEASITITAIELYNARTDTLISDITSDVTTSGLTSKTFATLGYDVIIYPGTLAAFGSMANGQYYMAATINGVTYYSEVFTVVNDIAPYLKLEWWDDTDFVMDAGTIVYDIPGGFHNLIYLPSDIAKPEYIFEEEGESRDGYFFPTKQISEKKYRFAFLASEYLLDVLRFVRMADNARIIYHGQTYSLDTFLITPTWEDNGDVASVEAEFETATVAKKIGVGYMRALRGDFNDDFNNDFNNN